MQRISLIRDPDWSSVVLPDVRSLWRLEPRDSGRWRYCRFFSTESHTWKCSDTSDRYSSHYRSTSRPDDLSMSFGYFFDFDDGTRGACRVSLIHEALAQLGCRIDGDAEPTYERRYADDARF